MAIDQLLKKNFWIVVLPLVAVAALLNAQAITQLVGISLMPDESQLAAPPVVAKKSTVLASTARSLSADPILSRNPFDHVTGSLLPRAEAEAEQAEGEPEIDMGDPRHAPPCEGTKVLVIAASSDPEWSLAAFSGDDGKSILRRRGGDVGGKTVEYVGWDRVWLRNGSTLCQAQLFSKEGEAPKAAAPPPPVASAAPKKGAPALDPSMAKGIQRVSATEFNIDRGVVDKILENQAELMKQARIIPEQENGKVVGIRMYGIRPETLLGTLGMENGDRLQTINGFDMASPEKALEAYARLRTADKLTVQVNRNGKTMNLDYNIK